MGIVYNIVKINPKLDDFVPYISMVTLHPFEPENMDHDLQHEVGMVVASRPSDGKVSVRYSLPDKDKKMTLTLSYTKLMLVESKGSGSKSPVFSESNPNRTFRNRRNT